MITGALSKGAGGTILPKGGKRLGNRTKKDRGIISSPLVPTEGLETPCINRAAWETASPCDVGRDARDAISSRLTLLF